MTTHRLLRGAAAPAAALLLFLPGCGKPYRAAEVDRGLLPRGRPGHKVHIQFIPDADKGTTGPIAAADTDAEGRFTLRLMEGDAASSRPGAVVGWHRVVLSDRQLAESATGRGVPIRF